MPSSFPTISKKLFPKIILEGTSLTFKTQIAISLAEHEVITGHRRYRYHNPIISAEWTGFTPYRWGRSLINFNDDEAESALKAYEHWVSIFELQPYCPWIIERFHISTMACQLHRYSRPFDLYDLDKRLSKCGFRLALVTRHPDSFVSARERRLRVSDNPERYNDLEYFVKRQEIIRSYYNRSVIEKCEFDISDNNIPRVVQEICDWMSSCGGLQPLP